MREISFSLPSAYKSPNQYLGRSKFALFKYRKLMRESVIANSRHLIPKTPFEYAEVKIERHSVGVMDYDNLVSGAKAIIDCLTTPKILKNKTSGARIRIRNKAGLGFIVDDSPDRARLIYRGVKCAKRIDQKTVITIRELDSLDSNYGDKNEYRSN